MRYSQSEKLEIIRLVEGSELSVNRTLRELDIPRSTFYGWYQRYELDGFDGLSDHTGGPKRIWNRIPDAEREKVVKTALLSPEKTPRELAIEITDEECDQSREILFPLGTGETDRRIRALLQF
jgi:transposase-like protein